MNSNRTPAASAHVHSWCTAPWQIIVWGTAGLLLLLPLATMQLTDEVTWDLADFVVFGTMLAVACGSFELAARMTHNRAYRAGMAMALATAFILIWINLAVGILGNEGNPANLMYWGVLAVGVIGAFMARFRADGMARALVATALAQTAAAVLALISGWGYTVLLTGVFVALWLAAAHLFRQAARVPAQHGAQS